MAADVPEPRTDQPLGFDAPSGNPAGGPIGSRHRQQLNSEFLAVLLRDFRQGGPKAIERVPSRPYAMFKDYWKYDWVLPVY